MHTPVHPKRNAEATKARILEAAKLTFSRTGYSHTGIREIAGIAGTSSTLILRYFGSKAGLFEASLREALASGRQLMGSTPSGVASSLAMPFETGSGSARPLMMMAMASGEPEAAEIAKRVYTEMALLPLGERLGEPNGKTRALQLSMLGIGYAFFMRHLPLDCMSEEDHGEISAWFANTVTEVMMHGSDNEAPTLKTN